mgnify:CR=1 FL=1
MPTLTAHSDTTGLDHAATDGTYDIDYANQEGEHQTRYTNSKKTARAHASEMDETL